MRRDTVGTRLRGRSRWLAPACLAILTLGTPGVVAADSNVPPAVTASVSNSNSTEPQTVVANATFNDPESATETYTCTVDYGDGAVVPGVVSGLACAGPAHHYSVTGTYNVTVTVTDSDGASGSGVATASYVNVAPWVGGLGIVGPHETGLVAHADAAIVDPGSDIETYQCTSVDYGDGTPLQSGTLVTTGWSDGLPRCVFPDHIYAVAGKYTLTAVVTDGGGAIGSCRAIETIVPYLPPQVIAPGNQTVDSTQGRHDFDLGSFTDPNGVIAAPWSWSVDWGDGSAEGATTESQGAVHAGHTYATGIYTASLTVSNSAGISGYAVFRVTAVDPNSSLTFQWNPLIAPEGVDVYNQITINDPAATAPFVVHTDFGDGTSQDQVVTTNPFAVFHTYVGAAPTLPRGTYTAYTAVVTVRDANGIVRTGSFNVRVEDVPPVVTAPTDIGFAETATSLTLASFTDASVGPWVVTIDGLPGGAISYTFQQPSSISIPYSGSLGDRTVTVTVRDQIGMSGSATVRIHIVNNAAPVVGTIAVPSPLLEGAPFTVNADFSDPGYGTGSGSETYTCTVDFGDGSGPAPGVVTGRTCTSRPWNYDTVGVYTVTVAVRDSRGGVGTASTVVDVANVAPALDPITADGSGYEGPVTVSTTFWDPGLDGSEEYACSIDYGDGTGLEVGTMDWAACTGAPHFYAHPGTYTVTMTVTDSHGAAGVGTIEVESGNANPEVWTGTLTGPVAEGGLATITAEFTDPGSELGSNSESYSCTAAFGDGATPVAGVVTGTTCTAQTTLLDPDPYWVTVTVTDSNGAQGSIAFWIEVSNVAPVVAAVSTGPAIEGQAIVATASFTDPGYGSAETYSCSVDYGDGSGPQVGAVSGNACQGPPHTYARLGTYTITVIVSDSNGGTSSASKSVSVSNVAPAIVKVTATPALTKTGSTVTASASFTDPGTSEKYTATWDWGDGSTTVVNLGSAARSVGGSHVYSRAGFYKVKLTVSDGQASGSMEASQVVVYDPARTLSGSGSLTSPAGSCRLSKGCSAAGTAGFSLSVSYAKAATKPTLSLAFSVSGFSFDATAADWMVAGGGTATVQGAGKVNGAGGYTFRLAAIDGKPDAMRLQVWSPSGVLVYDNGSVAPLKAGSITVK